MNTENTANVSKLGRNSLGTLDITMKIKGMRKYQSFIVYPISKNSKSIKIQSDTRIGTVDLEGNGKMSKSHSNGAYFHHLSFDELTPFNFNDQDWEEIKKYIYLTGVINDGEGTNSIVKIQNQGARSIFDL